LRYKSNMPARPVQISIDDDLLKRIDRDPETRQKGRSAFIRSAALLYLGSKRRRSIDAQIRTAFAGKKELADEAEDLIGAQSWPRR